MKAILGVLMVAALGQSVWGAGAAIYAPAGTCRGFFDTFTHYREAAYRTFPHPDGHLPGLAQPLGMTLLPDGRVAVLLDDRVTPNHANVVYSLHVNVPASSSRTNRLTYEASSPAVPRYSANPDLAFAAGPAIDSDGSFVFVGVWQDWTVSTNMVFRKYLLSTPQGGGEARMLMELPRHSPGIATRQADYYSAVVHVDAQGADPEGFLLCLHGTAGSTPFFMFVDRVGNIVREIFLDEFLPTDENPCYYARYPLAKSGDDFLTMACASGLRNVCVRFDRYGAFKGAWTFNAALPADPWLPPDPFLAFSELPNGDLLTGSQFAEYILGTGDRSGTTWRYFVLRPPNSFASPVCLVAPEEKDFGALPFGSPQAAEITIQNPGAAELVFSASVSGEGAGAFRTEGALSGSLPPTYGAEGAGGSHVFRIGFDPPSPGACSAEIVVESNDPSNPTQRVPLSGFATPPGYADTVIFDTGDLTPWPNEAKSFSVSPDGDTLTFLFEMVTDTNRYGRAIDVPAVRSTEGRLMGGSAAAAVDRIPRLGRSRFGVLEGPDGTLWYGPTFTSEKTVYQRKPDAAEYAQELTVGNGPPYDFDFTPDGLRLLIARGVSRIYRYTLSPKADGFRDLVYDGRLLLDNPSGFYAFAVWPESEGNFLLYSASDGLRVALGADRFWYRDGPPLSPPASTLVAPPVSSTDLGRDPVSGDLLYLDTERKLHRIDGFRALIPSVPEEPPLRIAQAYMDFGWRQLTVGWSPWSEGLFVESSTNLTGWEVLAGPLSGTSAVVPLGDGPLRFWRVRRSPIE